MMENKAFTLAETLITIAIIGIVATITIPTLVKNFQEKVRTSRIQNIEQKLSKATDKMMATDGLNGYGSTKAFVDTLSKHLKISKICTPENISDCWPTETVKANSEEFEIKTLKSPSNLQLNNTKYDNPMGIITVDGTAMIFSYNKECNVSYSKDFKQTSDLSPSTTCIAGIFDWNGQSKPNKLGDDVISLNGGSLVNCTVMGKY